MTTYSAPIPGLHTINHWRDVPMDWQQPTGGSIRIYAREVRAIEYDDDRPWLLFLQGGPGGKSPRPLTRSGWLAEAVGRYRVLLLDQRGTGRSAPMTQRVATSMSAEDLAAYAAHFRADSIVKDAEAFRTTIAGGAKWTTLGQSYGGFCTFTYLSQAPEGLERCLVTGGVPPIGLSAEQVYRRTWQQVLRKNAEYFRRFPADVDVVKRIRDALGSATLPSGDPMTVDRLQALGIAFGGSTGFADVHYLLEEAFDGDELSYTFCHGVQSRTDQGTSPLYALLQEAIYCEGGASQWAATRTRAEIPSLATGAEQLLFTGEMMEAWRFKQEAALAPYRAAAHLLHEKEDWPALYDEDALAGNDVPVAAAIYYDDMYVDAQASLAVVDRVPRVRGWVSNQYEHDGLRADATIFNRLHDLVTGRE